MAQVNVMKIKLDVPIDGKMVLLFNEFNLE